VAAAAGPRSAAPMPSDDEERGVRQQLLPVGPIGQRCGPADRGDEPASWVIIGSHSESLVASGQRGATRRAGRPPRRPPSWAAHQRRPTYATPRRSWSGQLRRTARQPRPVVQLRQETQAQRAQQWLGVCRCPHRDRAAQRLPGAPHSRRPAPRTARTMPATADVPAESGWRKLAAVTRTPALTVRALMSPASSRATRRTRRPSSSSAGERCATGRDDLTRPVHRDRLCSGQP